MKNFLNKHLFFALLFITIPIQAKISTTKISNKISSFFSKSKEETIHQEFNNVTRLEIFSNHAAINIECWKQNCVLVELKKKGNAAFLETIQLKTLKKDGTLQISTDMQDETISGTATIRILVPKNIAIHAQTISKSIIIKKVSGPLEIASDYGDVSIIQGSNTVIAKTQHSNILIQRKKMKSDHTLNISSLSGNITLAVPQNINADLQAHTTSGKIISDLFVTLHPQTIQLHEETFKNMHHHVHGMIGQPILHVEPATILLSTESGNIKIYGYDHINKKK